MTTDDFQPLTAPPIGLRPRHIWNDIHPTPGRDAIHERIQEILAAVGRYLDAGREPREEWFAELEERAEQLKDLPTDQAVLWRQWLPPLTFAALMALAGILQYLLRE
jgi:hypothetical protein